MNQMTIEQVAEYFINSIATRPVYPEDPTQRWYRICNEIYQYTQAGWSTNELCDKFYAMATEYPNITGHAYYVGDLIGHTIPKAMLPPEPTYIEVPWEDTPTPLYGDDPYEGFTASEQQQPVEYGAPATPIEQTLDLGEPAIPTPPLTEEPVIELPTRLEETPTVEMPEDNPWGNLATIHLLKEFHTHKDRLGLDNETIIPHVRHFLQKEEAAFEDINPDNIAQFIEYLMTIQS